MELQDAPHIVRRRLEGICAAGAVSLAALDDRIVLTVEHRAAAAMPGIRLELIQRGNALALQPAQPDHPPEHHVEPTSVDQRITAALVGGEQPPPFSELRASCRVPTTTLYERLAAMIAAGLVVKSADGYSLAGR